MFVFRDTLRAAPQLRLLLAALVMFAVSAALDFGFLEAIGIELPDDDSALGDPGHRQKR